MHCTCMCCESQSKLINERYNIKVDIQCYLKDMQRNCEGSSHVINAQKSSECPHRFIVD